MPRRKQNGRRFSGLAVATFTVAHRSGTLVAAAFAAVCFQRLGVEDQLSHMTTALLILGIGFLLGMRHATDPDHVVAVSTIVSRESSFPRAAWIGMLWGIGHSLTILVVGATIILFGVAIPPRLGLTLEFSVALMLILLGVLNLTGAIDWISHRFAPTHPRHHGWHSHLHTHGDYAHDHPHAHGS